MSLFISTKWYIVCLCKRYDQSSTPFWSKVTFYIWSLLTSCLRQPPFGTIKFIFSVCNWNQCCVNEKKEFSLSLYIYIYILCQFYFISYEVCHTLLSYTNQCDSLQRVRPMDLLSEVKYVNYWKELLDYLESTVDTPVHEILILLNGLTQTTKRYCGILGKHRETLGHWYLIIWFVGTGLSPCNHKQVFWL